MTEAYFWKKTIFKSLADFECLPLDIRIANFAVAEGNCYHIKRHIHPEYEIMIPLKGCYRSRLNGKILEVRRNEFILIQTNDDHEDLCDNDFQFAAIRFSILDSTGTARTIPILKKEIPPEDRIFPLPEGCAAFFLFRRAQSASSGENLIRRQAAGPLAHAMFWELLSLIPNEKFAEEFLDAFTKNQLLSRLEHVFSTHLDRTLTVDRIAGLLGMSRRVLEYKLKQMGAPSPLRLFTHRRIQEAIQLLKYEGQNVSQTAQRLGFANQFHFSKVFRSVTGLTPTDFLKRSTPQK